MFVCFVLKFLFVCSIFVTFLFAAGYVALLYSPLQPRTLTTHAMLKLIVVGRLVHALERGQPLEMFTGAIAVNEAGRIVRVDKGDVAVVAGDDVLGNRDATSDDESGGDENVQPDVDLLSYREKLEQRWKDELAVDCRVGGVRVRRNS